MTENEKKLINTPGIINGNITINEAIRKMCDALDELERYKAIGTIEELQELKEKSVAKKMSIGNDNGKPRKCCGNCGCFVLPASSYCSKCGQKLNWSE